MALTGENFKRFHWAKQSKKEQIKVSKKEEQRIKSEIKQLQDYRSKCYNNDDITDEELNILEKEINKKINQLIASLY